MKKFIEEHIKVIIIIVAVSILLLGILILVFSQHKSSSKESDSSIVNPPIKELPGTKRYTTEKLRSRHCLDSICVGDATFYYIDNQGRVDYVLTNISNDVKTGYLKMVFGEQSLVIAYDSLKPMQSVKTSSHYKNITFESKEDYVLEELNSDDLSHIKKS